MTIKIFQLGSSAPVDSTTQANDVGGDSGTTRSQWGNQMEFVLALVGYAVGLGNLWRFPYLCFQNGGGAFLVPYFISLLLAGMPIVYLELAIGQYSSLGPTKLFAKMSPVFQGVGWAMVAVTFVVATYYTVVSAWVIVYFVLSVKSYFDDALMWDTCGGEWNTAECVSDREDARCVQSTRVNTSVFFDGACHNDSSAMDAYFAMAGHEQVMPAEEFFNNWLYGLKDVGPDFWHFGSVRWPVLGALALVWFLVFLCICRGLASFGKVVYFTSIFPYIVLTALLIRGVTLPGDGPMNGIRFYITPSLEKLSDPNVWRFAATQIFYSLSPCFGSLLSMASYNKFNHNCYRDAVVVSIINSLTSVFAGFAVFSTLGYMADVLHKNVSDVAQGGPALAFVAYPEAIVRMPSPWPSTVSLVFFFMLFTLGLGSVNGVVQSITTALFDQFPKMRRGGKLLVTAAACIAMFLCAIPLCFESGIYLFTVFDAMSATYALLAIGFLEYFVVCYCYGIKRFIDDLELMLGKHHSLVGLIVGNSGWYWRIMWLFVSPLIVILIFILSITGYQSSTYNRYTFPLSANIVGWIIAFIPIAMIPLFAAGQIVEGALQGWTLSELIRPVPGWGTSQWRAQYKAQQAAFATGSVPGRWAITDINAAVPTVAHSVDPKGDNVGNGAIG